LLHASALPLRHPRLSHIGDGEAAGFDIFDDGRPTAKPPMGATSLLVSLANPRHFYRVLGASNFVAVFDQ